MTRYCEWENLIIYWLWDISIKSTIFSYKINDRFLKFSIENFQIFDLKKKKMSVFLCFNPLRLHFFCGAIDEAGLILWSRPKKGPFFGEAGFTKSGASRPLVITVVDDFCPTAKKVHHRKTKKKSSSLKKKSSSGCSMVLTFPAGESPSVTCLSSWAPFMFLQRWTFFFDDELFFDNELFLRLGRSRLPR